MMRERQEGSVLGAYLYVNCLLSFSKTGSSTPCIVTFVFPQFREGSGSHTIRSSPSGVFLGLAFDCLEMQCDCQKGTAASPAPFEMLWHA